MDQLLHGTLFLIMQKRGGMADGDSSGEQQLDRIVFCEKMITGLRQIAQAMEADLFFPFDQWFPTYLTKTGEKEIDQIIPKIRYIRHSRLR